MYHNKICVSKNIINDCNQYFHLCNGTNKHIYIHYKDKYQYFNRDTYDVLYILLYDENEIDVYTSLGYEICRCGCYQASIKRGICVCNKSTQYDFIMKRDSHILYKLKHIATHHINLTNIKKREKPKYVINNEIYYNYLSKLIHKIVKNSIKFELVIYNALTILYVNNKFIEIEGVLFSIDKENKLIIYNKNNSYGTKDIDDYIIYDISTDIIHNLKKYQYYSNAYIKELHNKYTVDIIYGTFDYMRDIVIEEYKYYRILLNTLYFKMGNEQLLRKKKKEKTD